MTRITCGECNGQLWDLDNTEDYKRLVETLSRYEEKLMWDHMGEDKSVEDYMFRLIKDGIKMNLIAYDEDAVPGEMTRRLIQIMVESVDGDRSTFKNGTLRTIYASSTAYNNLSWTCSNDEIMDRRDRYFTIRGVEIIQDPRLDELNKESKGADLQTGKITTYTRRNGLDYYFALGGNLADQDRGLVVGVCNNGIPIMGSY